MQHLCTQLFILLVGIFWAILNGIRIFFTLFKIGPRRLLEKEPQNSIPPVELFDPKYGKHSYINIGPIKMHYAVSGPENAPLMLMVHGFPECWFSWRYQILEFQKDFRVVAVDMRGFGDTDKPEGVENYKLDLLVEDLRLFIEALGYTSCVLVSHDWGGAVCWALAAQHPELVDRLVIMNIPPVPLWHQGFTSIRKPLQFLCSWYIYFFQLPFLPEFGLGLQDHKAIEQMYRDPPGGLRISQISDDEVNCYKYYFRAQGAWTAGVNYYRANFYPPVSYHNLDYSMPIHIIWGSRDPFLSATVLEDTLRAIPKATVTHIPEASHWVQVDDPVKVNTSIRKFLHSTNFKSSN